MQKIYLFVRKTFARSAQQQPITAVIESLLLGPIIKENLSKSNRCWYKEAHQLFLFITRWAMAQLLLIQTACCTWWSPSWLYCLWRHWVEIFIGLGYRQTRAEQWIMLSCHLDKSSESSRMYLFSFWLVESCVLFAILETYKREVVFFSINRLWLVDLMLSAAHGGFDSKEYFELKKNKALPISTPTRWHIIGISRRARWSAKNCAGKKQSVVLVLHLAAVMEDACS